MPLAAFTQGPAPQGMQLNAVWGDPVSAEAHSSLPTKPLVYAQKTAVVRNFEEAQALGEAVAAQLRAAGSVWASNPASISNPAA